MRTRSFIIQQHSRQNQPCYTGIYCHLGGQPNHNGRILEQHYSKPRKLSRLIGLGDISGLQPLVERDHSGKPYTIAYQNDPGESRASTSAAESGQLTKLMQIARESACEYVYLFDGEYWSVARRTTQYFGSGSTEPFTAFAPLDEVLAQEQLRQVAR